MRKVLIFKLSAEGSVDFSQVSRRGEGCLRVREQRGTAGHVVELLLTNIQELAQCGC